MENQEDFENKLREWVDLDEKLKESNKEVRAQINEIKKRSNEKVNEIKEVVDIVKKRKEEIEETIKSVMESNGMESIQINGGFIQLSTKQKVQSLSHSDERQLLMEFLGDRAQEYQDFLASHSETKTVTTLSRVKRLKTKK